jgi:hypothetical protein
VGKYYPFTNSQPHAESFAVSERDANSFGNTLSFTVADVRISSCHPSSEYAELDVYTEELTRCDAKSNQETEAVNSTMFAKTQCGAACTKG